MSIEELENLNDPEKIEVAIVELQSTVRRLEFKRETLLNRRKEEIEELFTVTQVKNILHISEQLVYKLISQKKLNAVEIGGVKRVKKVDVLDYIEKNSTFIK